MSVERDEQAKTQIHTAGIAIGARVGTGARAS
jgi:hypothetical protein